MIDDFLGCTLTNTAQETLAGVLKLVFLVNVSEYLHPFTLGVWATYTVKRRGKKISERKILLGIAESRDAFEPLNDNLCKYNWMTFLDPFSISKGISNNSTAIISNHLYISGNTSKSKCTSYNKNMHTYMHTVHIVLYSIVYKEMSSVVRRREHTVIIQWWLKS